MVQYPQPWITHSHSWWTRIYMMANVSQEQGLLLVASGADDNVCLAEFGAGWSHRSLRSTRRWTNYRQVEDANYGWSYQDQTLMQRLCHQTGNVQSCLWECINPKKKRVPKNLDVLLVPSVEVPFKVVKNTIIVEAWVPRTIWWTNKHKRDRTKHNHTTCRNVVLECCLAESTQRAGSHTPWEKVSLSMNPLAWDDGHLSNESVWSTVKQLL